MGIDSHRGARTLNTVDCRECGISSGAFWIRWRAYRIDDPEYGELPALAFYCPAWGAPAAPELTVKAFLGTWAGAPARRLYSRILSTMPLTDPGSLDPKTVLDITTFILNENKQPVPAAGYASPAELDKISIRNGG